MSKDQRFVESPAQPSFVPSAPPTYDEAMQQASAAYPSLPAPAQGPAGPYFPQPIHMMPMPMPQPAPYVPVAQPPAAAPAPAPTIVFTSLGRDRSITVCHKCNAQITTETQESSKFMAHVLCCILMFSCPCCCCIPYCMDSCKIVKHKCPNCGSKLGTWRG